MEKRDFYSYLEQLFENPSSASEGKSFTFKKSEQNKNEWNLVEYFIEQDYNDDGSIIPNHDPVQHTSEAQKQIKLFLEALKTDKDNQDETVYRFDIQAPVFDSLICNIVQNFAGTPEQVLNLYEKCYQHNQQSYLRFLKSSQLDKNMFTAFFEHGYEYPKIMNAKIISDGRLRKFFETIETSLYAEDELKNMIFTHFQNSKGLSNLKNVDVLKILNQVLPQADAQRMLFEEKILSSFNQYNPTQASDDEQHHMGYFNISLTEIMGKYAFSSIDDINKLMDALEHSIQSHHQSLGLDSVAYKWIKKDNTEYLRVLVESINSEPANLEQLRAIHYQVFDAHTQWNVIDNPKALNDIILYHIFSERFEHHEDDENKTFTESSGKMKI